MIITALANDEGSWEFFWEGLRIPTRHRPSPTLLSPPCPTRVTTVASLNSIILLRVSCPLLSKICSEHRPLKIDVIGAPGPPQGQGYYPQQPQQSYQGYPGQPGQYQPGYTPQQPPQTVYVFVFAICRVSIFLIPLQSTGKECWWRNMHSLFSWYSLLLLRRGWVLYRLHCTAC
jgi:hypothetical protein